MALLAESLVEEWLNRKGYFTIRGVKDGVNEMDLLAVCPQPGGSITGWHVEVQASFRPVNYIAKRTEEMVATSGGSATSSKKRTRDEIESCARKWVAAKFLAHKKARLRERLWPGVEWSFHLVHAVVREPYELEVFAKEGVVCHPLHRLLADLSQRDGPFSGSAGGDLAEVIGYYKSHEPENAQSGGGANSCL